MPVPEFILEQLSIHVEDKTPADHVFVGSKSGSVLRNRTFRPGWFNDAAEQICIPGLPRTSFATPARASWSRSRRM